MNSIHATEGIKAGDSYAWLFYCSPKKHLLSRFIQSDCLLIIFFILTTTFVVTAGRKMDIPSGSSSPSKTERLRSRPPSAAAGHGFLRVVLTRPPRRRPEAPWRGRRSSPARGGGLAVASRSTEQPDPRHGAQAKTDPPYRLASRPQRKRPAQGEPLVTYNCIAI